MSVLFHISTYIKQVEAIQQALLRLGTKNPIAVQADLDKEVSYFLNSPGEGSFKRFSPLLTW